jgi:hypothetical protein
MRNQYLFVWFILLSVFLALPALSGTLDTLKPNHPRVLAHAEDFDRIAKIVKTDPLAKRWYGELKERSMEVFDEPVAQYNLRDGRRLLYESRDVLGRVQTFAMLYKIEGQQRYLDRIWADLEAAAAFKDWNPDHFLDVAVMAAAYAIAYDWLYDHWSDAQRTTMREAIVKHAIKPGLLAYERKTWWTYTSNNWNQVCNGGLIMASLAIADREPQLATKMIDKAVAALPISMKRYAPDGGYDEGPGYWSFGTTYNVLAIASLQSALGHDLKLGDAAGFDATGGFPVQMTGATGKAYNFGDGKARTPRSAIMFYLAKKYDQPGYARFAAEHNRGSAMDLLWYDPAVVNRQANKMPLAAVFHSADIGVLRSAWDDPDAWYVGLKGGAIDHGHAQLDLGSFILESQNLRWLIDLGADDYNLPGYFQSGAARWRYYRNRAEGHNTLVVNPGASPADQRRDATVKIDLDQQTLSADLTPAYTGKVHRKLALDQAQDHVRVVDRLAFDAPAEVWWFAHTKATIELADDRRSAILKQDGKRLRATIVSPAKATFAVMDAAPLPSSPKPEGQNPNNGAVIQNSSRGAHFVLRGELPVYGKPDPSDAIRKLAIHLQGVTETAIEVRFENVK